MRNRILTLTVLIAAMTLGILSFGLKPAHAGGGASMTVKITAINPSYSSPQGRFVAVYVHVHALGYATVPASLDVFFKKPGSSTFLKNGANYVHGHKGFTPGSADWQASYIMYVPLSAFPNSVRGQNLVAEASTLVTTGEFPYAQNTWYTSNAVQFKLPAKLIDGGPILNGVHEG